MEMYIYIYVYIDGKSMKIYYIDGKPLWKILDKLPLKWMKPLGLLRYSHFRKPPMVFRIDRLGRRNGMGESFSDLKRVGRRPACGPTL